MAGPPRKRGPDDALIGDMQRSDLCPIADPRPDHRRHLRRAATATVSLLNACYAKVIEMAPVMKRLRDARKTPQEALEAGIVSDAEMDRDRRR